MQLFSVDATGLNLYVCKLQQRHANLFATELHTGKDTTCLDALHAGPCERRLDELSHKQDEETAKRQREWSQGANICRWQQGLQ